MSQVLILVIGAVLGLLAGQGSELLRLRREEKRAIGRALKTLLYIRHNLRAIKESIADIKELFSIPSQQLIQFQQSVLTFLLPNMEGLEGRYQEAIDVVSGVNPLLGFQLAKKTELLPTIMRAMQAVGLTEQVSTIWLNMEADISDPSILDDLILELAELHSIDTRYEVKRHLDDNQALASDIANRIKEQVKALKNTQQSQL
jgi:hypothetical protein